MNDNVQEAIWTLNHFDFDVDETEYGTSSIDKEWVLQVKDAINLAITALQAYQPKNPCVICENGDDEFVCFEDDGERIKNEAETRAIIARGEQYCRFCGRPLKGE